MKRAGAISAAILFLLLGTAFAQQDQPRKEQAKPPEGQRQPRPAEQPQRQQPAQPQRQQPAQPQHQVAQPQQPQPAQQARRSQVPRPAQPQERPQSPYGSAYYGGVRTNGPTNAGVHHSGIPQEKGQVRSGFNQSRASHWDDDHRTWTQRGGYSGYRVPEPRFRQYYGRDHYFRIFNLPMLFVGGFPRFRYDGYWVTFMDPWPDTWPDNWYETDDVYLDYTDDGYYLYDRMRPSPGIAVTITF